MDTYPHRYLNPPDVVELRGRLLARGAFEVLQQHLLGGELLVGTYVNRAGATVATVLDSTERMAEMEGLYAPASGYYAVPMSLISSGQLRVD